MFSILLYSVDYRERTSACRTGTSKSLIYTQRRTSDYLPCFKSDFSAGSGQLHLQNMPFFLVPFRPSYLPLLAKKFYSNFINAYWPTTLTPALNVDDIDNVRHLLFSKIKALFS
jgi:hypothetical protein